MLDSYGDLLTEGTVATGARHGSQHPLTTGVELRENSCRSGSAAAGHHPAPSGLERGMKRGYESFEWRRAESNGCVTARLRLRSFVPHPRRRPSPVSG